MSITAGPKISRDGLIYYLDASNPKSYSGAGDWVDLTETQSETSIIDCEYYNSPQESFSVQNDGEYTSLGETPASLQGDPNFTICGFFLLLSDYGSGSMWGIGGDSSGEGISTFNHTGTNEITIDLWGNTTYTTGVTLSNTNWKFCAWTKTSGSFLTSSVSIFVDDIKYTGTDLTALRSGTNSVSINNGGIVIGRAGATTNDFYSKIFMSNFMVYDRVLSDIEIIQNRKALKTRYVETPIAATAAGGGSSPVVDNFTFATSSSITDSLDVTKPTGVSVGDLLVIMVGADDNSTTDYFNDKTGWTKNAIVQVGSQPDVHQAYYHRVADGTEGATETIDTSGTWRFWVGFYLRVTGADTIDPYDSIGALFQGADGGSTMTIPELTTNSNDCLVIALGAYDGGDSNGWAPSGTGWPTSFGTDQDKINNVGVSSGTQLAWTTKTVATAGVSSDCIYTYNTNDGTCGQQIAFKA